VISAETAGIQSVNNPSSTALQQAVAQSGDGLNFFPPISSDNNPGTKLKGHITAVEPVSFTLRDAKTGTSQRIAYSEVDSVSKAGGSISTKTWFIIGGVAAGAVTTKPLKFSCL